ncbi:hypothetical protein Q0M10_14320, partial [Staphylococcus aureus]|nr:hypothetical protein [Staphylococcus aureus]
ESLAQEASDRLAAITSALDEESSQRAAEIASKILEESLARTAAIQTEADLREKAIKDSAANVIENLELQLANQISTL